MTRRTLALCAVFSSLPAALVAGFMLFAALDHNPQEEFYSASTGLQWESAVPLVGVWFLVVFIPAFLFSLAMAALAGSSDRSPHPGKQPPPLA